MVLPEEQTFHIHSDLHDETLNNLMSIRDHGGTWYALQSHSVEYLVYCFLA